MTLKREGSSSSDQQLSFRARAFSVEALLQKSSASSPVYPGEDSICQQAESSSTEREASSASSFIGECSGIKPVKREITSPTSNLQVELCSRDLWRKFHTLGTEMIITKAGRRMFPTVKVRLHGLQPDVSYIIFLDIIPVDDKRYRYVYHSSQWTVAGAGDPPLPRSLYVHPDSPASGQLWMAQGVISFDKLKLTNNRRPMVRGQVSLHSMHKYQPRVHVLPTEDLESPAETQIAAALASKSTLVHTFSFSETCFTTVTAYQNQQITRLKIASNPFAKGFREASKSRDHLDESQQSFTRIPHFSSIDLGSNPNSYFNESTFNPSWPPAPINLPIKFVIPPSGPLGPPMIPYLQGPPGFPCPYRPPYFDCLRPQPPQQLMFSHPLSRTAAEALDLSTFK